MNEILKWLVILKYILTGAKYPLSKLMESLFLAKIAVEMTDKKDGKPSGSMLSGILRMKCPNCRSSPMFRDPNPYHLKNMGVMNERCPVCGHPIDPEAGYYFGAMYVSYA